MQPWRQYNFPELWDVSWSGFVFEIQKRVVDDSQIVWQRLLETDFESSRSIWELNVGNQKDLTHAVVHLAEVTASIRKFIHSDPGIDEDQYRVSWED